MRRLRGVVRCDWEYVKTGVGEAESWDVSRGGAGIVVSVKLSIDGEWCGYGQMVQGGS